MPWLLLAEIALALWGAMLEPWNPLPRRPGSLPPRRPPSHVERYEAALRAQQERPSAKVIPLRGRL